MSIKRTPKNKYALDMRDVYGNRIRLEFERKQDAQAYEAKINKEKYDIKLNNLSIIKKRYLIEECLNDFRASKTNLRPKSYQRYSGIILEIINFVKAMKINYLDEFTSDHATLFYNELIKERTIDKGNHTVKMKAAPKTINFYLMVLKSFFKQELIRDHIAKNPTLHIKNLKEENKRPDFYTPEELESFFNQPMHITYRNFFLGLLYSGMRYGEAAHLTWDDVDFNRKLIYIRQKEYHRLKTKSSERSIPMNDQLFNLLSDCYKNKTADWVFTNRIDSNIKERRALQICKDVAEKAGIKNRAYLHKFRSTYATMLVRNDISLESIKELLGHASLAETESAYANNDSNYLHSKVKVLDNLLNINLKVEPVKDKEALAKQ